jgi:hypothetical protein
MKLFVRLLLEAVRAAMIVRNDSKQSDALLGQFSESTRESLRELATTPASPINSHLLMRLLRVYDETTRSPLPFLPLEIAIVEHVGSQ